MSPGRLPVLLTMLAVGCVCCCANADDFREFRDKQRRSVTAKVVDVTAEEVTIERHDGRRFTVPIDIFVDDDQKFIRSIGLKPSAHSDWPAYRGSRRSGTSEDAQVPANWSDIENIVWKTELTGPGASSPITLGDRIYLTCYSGYGLRQADPGDTADLKRHLVCLNRSNGEVIWKRSQAETGRVLGYQGFVALHGYATNTPVADSSGVYVFHGVSGLLAYSHQGDLRWQKNCGQSAAGRDGWGSGSSPIIYKNLVIIHADVESNTMFAFDKRTGREAWKKTYQPAGQNTRATPLIANFRGSDQMIFHSSMGTLTSLDPATGQTLWQFDGAKNYQNPSPITDGNYIFVLTFQQGLALDPSGKRKWENAKGSEICTPIFHQGHLYWASEEGGIANCINADTGQVVYQERLQPAPGRIYSSGVMADGKIYYVSRENGTYVVSAKPQFQQLAHNVITSDHTIFNGTPAIDGNRLLIRSDRFLYCIGKK